MKIKILLFLTCFFSYQLLIAKNEKTSPHFLIKGKVSNANEPSWNLCKTTFFDNKVISVNIQKDGTFNQLISVEGMQDLYLYLNNNAITIYVQPNDTIELNWDAKNFENTFEIKSPNYDRNIDLQLNLKLHNKFRQAEESISKKLWEERNAESSSKFKWINDQYNQHLKAVLDDSNNFTATTSKFTNQIYFYYSKLLVNNKLVDKYSLIPDTTFLNPNNLPSIKRFIPQPDRYKVLNNAMFYRCPVYRNFLFDYIRFANKPFTASMIVQSRITVSANGDTIQDTSPYKQTKFYDKRYEVTTFTPANNDYYLGLSQINVISIRDWFITNAIFSAFEHYSFEDAENITLDFLPKCKTTVYKDTLVSYYSMIKKFRQKSPAPEFTLKDENGKSVSLSDFKGKVVYLDFWGVYCAPCRSDIKNYVPKLHAKYHDKDIAFINICVDVNEKIWKNTLSEIKLDGVNLLAGWPNSQVSKDYNIIGVPHYMLIDKYGKFADYNAPGPYDLIKDQENMLDRLLMDK